MCGIVGFASRDIEVDRALIETQRDSMLHRGPDSAGLWLSDDRRVGLAHRRLSIIDLSPGGHQPMVDPSSQAVISFNGEIYNYRTLRAELEARGERFRSSSDTEVVLTGFRHWGLDVFRRLDGMFALAIYEPAQRRLVLARDRAGEKPLFVHHSAGTVRFASELKALFKDPRVARRISQRALEEYLTYGYVSGTGCLVDGVQKLQPGSYAVFSLETGSISVERFWSIPAPGASTAAVALSEAELAAWTDRLDVLLRDAVSAQLVADVPIGVLLSGGLDSSLIAAYAREVSSASLSTYTVRMRGVDAVDESPFAEAVAQHLGTQHHVLDADDDTVDLLPRLLAQYDEPIADSSMVPTFLVSSAIRRFATVAVGGDGGDELFGGYFRYPVHIRQEALRTRVPASLRRIGGAVADVMPDSVRGRTFLRSLAGDAGTSIANVGLLFTKEERTQLLRSSSFVGAAWQNKRTLHSDRLRVLARSTAADFSTYMVDDVLVKVDRASMLASLEVRAPFLHRPVIEFAFGELPDALRATQSARKVILRRLARRYLPATFDSSRKQGFSIPLRTWLSGSWRPFVADVAAKGSSLLEPKIYRRALAAPPRTDREADQQFALLALLHWAETYGIS